MHIKTPQSALLSNHELHLHLVDESTQQKTLSTPPPPGLAHTLRDTLTYLSAPPPFSPSAAEPTLATKRPNRPKTLYQGPHSLFRALGEKYRLNKAEYLQIYNLRPRSAVVLELIVEEASTRFSDQDLEDMLAIIQQVFDQEEADIPPGVEDQEMEKLADKLVGTGKGRGAARKARGRKGKE